ncbi:hypothetical protein [Streptomyces sp. NPDC020597]|uniref:hypothetical protein n=1 Tax=unclassified Streptomyces TaxID=2593676 RepID=UPI003796963B
MYGEEPLRGAGLVELLEIVPVDVGDESAFDEFFRGRALVVADRDLDRGESGFAGGGGTAAAVDDDAGGTCFEVRLALWAPVFGASCTFIATTPTATMAPMR